MCHIIECLVNDALLYDAVLYYTVRYCTKPDYMIIHTTMLCCTLLYHMIAQRGEFYVQQFTMVYHIRFYYSILQCDTIYHTILY